MATMKIKLNLIRGLAQLGKKFFAELPNRNAMRVHRDIHCRNYMT